MSVGRHVAGICRVCGCTDDDCRQCVERTGEPCHWVEPDICSACVPAPLKRRAKTKAQREVCAEVDLVGGRFGVEAVIFRKQWKAPLPELVVLPLHALTVAHRLFRGTTTALLSAELSQRWQRPVVCTPEFAKFYGQRRQDTAPAGLSIFLFLHA